MGNFKFKSLALKFTAVFLVFITLKDSHAIRTFRHPTVVWREPIYLSGGGLKLLESNVDPSECNPVLAAPVDFSTPLRDCQYDEDGVGGPIAPIPRYLTSNSTFMLESWVVLTNISDINQSVRIKISGGSLGFGLESVFPSGTHTLTLSCIGYGGNSVAVTNNAISGTIFAPSATTFGTVPPQTSMICGIFPTFRVSSAADAILANVVNASLTFRGSYNIQVEIEEDRGAMSGTLYYNVTAPTKMATPKNHTSFFSRQTYLLNGGSPF